MPATTRMIALRITSRVRRDQAWIQDVISADPDFKKASMQDRAFITNLVRGTVAHAGTLDAVIDRFAARPSQIEPRVRDALRIATYELLYLSTPSRAAVNEGVGLVRSVQPRAAGFSNAVLRKIAEAVPEFPFDDPDTDLDAFALLTGHPAWMAHRLAEELGTERARTFMRADESPAPLYVATNPFLTDESALFAELEDAGCQPHALDVAGAFECDSAAATVVSAAVADGRAFVVDLSPQAIVSALPLADTTSILDLAAGRGTKSILLQAAAVRQDASSMLTAIELHEFKTRVLAKRMTDLHVPRVRAYATDATDARSVLEILGEPADLVFVDAPCSGLGTLRRHPERRWRMRPEDIDDMAALSARLLDAALSLVRPEGFVVYSTCTVVGRENQDVVEGALAQNGDAFEIVPIGDRIASSMQRWVTTKGYLQVLPEPGGPDGHFAAIVRRRR